MITADKFSFPISTGFIIFLGHVSIPDILSAPLPLSIIVIGIQTPSNNYLSELFKCCYCY